VVAVSLNRARVLIEQPMPRPARPLTRVSVRKRDD
jgi:hypothetical protein